MKKIYLFILVLFTTFIFNLGFAHASTIDTPFQNWSFKDIYNDNSTAWRGTGLNSTTTTLWTANKYGLISQFAFEIKGTFKAGNSYTTRWTLHFDYVQNSNPSIPLWSFEDVRKISTLSVQTMNYCSTVSSNTSTHTYTFECNYTPTTNETSKYFFWFIPSDLQNYNALYPKIGIFYPNNTSRVTISNISTMEYTSSDNVIIDQNNQIIQGQQQTNDKLDSINDSITSTDSPNLDELNNFVGYLPPGPLDSILNIPLTVLNSFLNNLNGQCKPVNITLPFVENTFELPCMYSFLSQMTGFTTLMDWISNICGTILLIKYLLTLYNWINNQTSLNEKNNDDWGGIS